MRRDSACSHSEPASRRSRVELTARFSAELFLAVVLFGFGGLLRSFEAVLVGMDAELVPVGFGEVDVVVLRGLFDVGEGESAIGFGDVEDLIEASDGVADVLCVGQGFFALVGEGEDGVGEIAAGGEVAVFFVGLPGWVRVGHWVPPGGWVGRGVSHM